MAKDDLPSREDITEGMTVVVEQEQENNPGEPLIGDVRHVITDQQTHPQGIKVELESDVTGRVKELNPDEP